MGHLHPAVTFYDEHTSKNEKYKCFLIGKYKKKELFILPSFLEQPIGTPVNQYLDEYKDYFSILPKRTILNCEIHTIGKDKIFNFGKVKDL